MEFMIGLPKTLGKHDSIRVTVERLTKLTYLILIRVDYNSKKMNKIYIKEIVRLYGVSFSIILDRYMQYTSKFWDNFHEKFGNKLTFSITFHPQIDGSSERIIQVFQDMLRAYRSILMVIGISSNHCVNFNTITTITLVFILPHLRHSMGGNVDHPSSGLRRVM